MGQGQARSVDDHSLVVVIVRVALFLEISRLGRGRCGIIPSRDGSEHGGVAVRGGTTPRDVSVGAPDGLQVRLHQVRLRLTHFGELTVAATGPLPDRLLTRQAPRPEQRPDRECVRRPAAFEDVPGTTVGGFTRAKKPVG
jgi:hypothetical protein